ncbi:MAG: SDR family oxidoreductase [SAR202 cluster bacterium]|nr:SDR family oxidoreductase [SAR202 cluster bacterium]
MLLEGKKALVTGSRRGIGRAIAVMLAQEGADVGVNDIERDQAAEDTLKMVRSHGRKASWHQADIARLDQVHAMLDAFLREHGRIDILVNNAVATVDKPFLDVTEADWDFEVGNALKGYFFCSQRAAKAMVKQGRGGRIVSLSSVQAHRQWPDKLVYGICKAGVERMTKGMAKELSGTGINVNAVAPGYIDSRLLPPDQEHTRGQTYYTEAAVPWIPADRLGVPDDIAKAVLFLCSPLAGYVSGQTLIVDGGFLTGGVPKP